MPRVPVIGTSLGAPSPNFPVPCPDYTFVTLQEVLVAEGARVADGETMVVNRVETEQGGFQIASRRNAFGTR